MVRQGVRPSWSQPVEISEQENNIKALNHTLQREIGYIFKAQTPKFPVITHSKCFLVSNLNLSGCNQSTVCLLGIGKHLDRKVILPFLSARTISQWNKYVCQGSGPGWQSPGAQEGTVANIDMGPPLGVGAGVLRAPRGLGALDLSLGCCSRSPLRERAHALPLAGIETGPRPSSVVKVRERG